MLAPLTRMKSILSRNGLEKGWHPETALRLAAISKEKAESLPELIQKVLDYKQSGAQGTEVLDGMDAILQTWEEGLVAHLMIVGMLGYDGSLLFNMATQAEAEGKPAGYRGVTASALLNYWGASAAPMLGLPVPREDS